MSRVLLFTGTESILSSDYMPPIDVSDGEYVMGLINFQTYHAISNVDKTNNMFYFNDEHIKLPEGSYELDDLAKLITAEMTTPAYIQDVGKH